MAEEEMQHDGVPNNEGPDQVNEEEEIKEEVNNLHPLDYEVVMRNLLSFLPLRDLKSCRLVNSLWNRVSIPYLKRKCGYVRFSKFDSYGDWSPYGNQGYEGMVKYVKCMLASSNFPYVKLVLGISVMSASNSEQAVLLLPLFRSVSRVITEVVIEEEWGYSLNMLSSQDIPEKLDFPSLEILTLHIDSTHDGDIGERNFQFITSILTNAPVLDKLVLVDHRFPYHWLTDSPNKKAVTSLLESISTAQCLQISTLEISSKIWNENLITLTKMGLKLKTLFLNFKKSLPAPENIKMFLRSQSPTLQTLKITDHTCSCQFSIDFPCMERLKFLMFEGLHDRCSYMSFPNISYAEQFPALKRLSFSKVTQPVEDFLKFGLQPVTTVEELKLIATHYFLEKVSFQHTCRIFPNIKLLEVVANIEFLSIAYDSMPNIEELILGEVNDADEIITGMAGSQFEESNHNLGAAMHQGDGLNYMVPLHATWKPISCLKNLKILSLKDDILNGPVELTNVSCHVLMEMTSLQCVDFYGRCSYQISEGVLSEMKKRIVVL